MNDQIFYRATTAEDIKFRVRNSDESHAALSERCIPIPSFKCTGVVKI